MIELIDVKPEERSQFLDVFARYWAELESHQDVKEPWIREDYSEFMDRSKATHFCWVTVDGARVGLAVYSLVPHWYRPGVREGYIDEIFIEPAHRRSGLAEAVARRMLDAIEATGATTTRLHVLPRNAGAAALWKRVGFEVEIHQMVRVSPRP